VTYAYRQVLCSECGGEGTNLTIARMSGEAIDSDWAEGPCSECNGMREIDASCANCLRILPLDSEGYCQQCTDSFTLPLGEYQARYGLVPVERGIDPETGNHRVAA